MKKILYKIGKFLSIKYCPHIRKKEVFTCYQDRYYKDKCLDCGKFIYEGFDDNIITKSDE